MMTHVAGPIGMLGQLRSLPVSVVHGGHYGSFGRERMEALVHSYRSAGTRIADPAEWVAARAPG